MKVLWAHLKRHSKIALAVLGGLLVAMAELLLLFSRKKKSEMEVDGPKLFERAIDGSRERIEAANAQAAVEVTVARAKDAALQEQLAHVMSDHDGARRRRNLIRLAQAAKGAGVNP